MMPLDEFLANPDAWAGYAHEPDNFQRISAYMSSIGARHHDTMRLGYYQFPDSSYAQVTTWDVPGYRGDHLLVADDRERDLSAADYRQSRSANMFIQDEYNPILGIDYYAHKYRDSILWLGAFADTMLAREHDLGKVGTILGLLRYEFSLGHSEIRQQANGVEHYHEHRPADLLTNNLLAAEVLANAAHLNTVKRKRYMSLDIPADLLPDLIKPSMPFDYVTSIYPRRTFYSKQETT